MTLNKQQCLYLIYVFVIGFVTNRLVNHQDIITGKVKEGNSGGFWDSPSVGNVALMVLSIVWLPVARMWPD